MDEIDRRTGEPYVDKDWGHGVKCRCLPCITSSCDDLVEAGLLEKVGEDDIGPCYRLVEEEIRPAYFTPERAGKH